MRQARSMHEHETRGDRCAAPVCRAAPSLAAADRLGLLPHPGDAECRSVSLAFADQLHPPLLVDRLQAHIEPPEPTDVQQHLIDAVRQWTTVVAVVTQGQ